MKKNSIFLGAGAFVLAIASAFTTKSSNVLYPGGHFVAPGVCTQFNTPCSTGNILTVFTSDGATPCSQGSTVFTTFTGDNKCTTPLRTRVTA